MKQNYFAESNNNFDEASDIAIRLRVLAGELFNVNTYVEWLKKQMFVNTAQDKYLDYFATQRGLARKLATCADGEITFTIKEVNDSDIYIPKGSVVATTDVIPLKFVTTEDAVLVAGNTLVSAFAKAEKDGKAGNIKKDTVIVPVSVPTEIDNVLCRQMFENGTDTETDDMLRERIKQTFVFPPNGTNKSYYERMALTIDGVNKVGIVAKIRGAGTINVYICDSNGACQEDVIKQVQDLLSKNRELNVDVLVLQAQYKKVNLDITIKAKSGFDYDFVKEQCSQCFAEYIRSLPIGGKFYLSSLGRNFINLDCVENYEFNTTMDNIQISSSQCFDVGEIEIEVE